MRQSDFEREIIKVYKQLLAYARFLTRDYDQANDLLQDTVLRMLMNRDKYSEQNCFIAWARLVMRNVFLNNEKSASRTRSLICGFDDGDSFSVTAVSDSESDYNCKEILSTIDSLSPPHAVVIHRRIEGYQYNDIAEEQKVPIGTVKSRMHIAIKQLGNLLRK